MWGVLMMSVPEEQQAEAHPHEPQAIIVSSESSRRGFASGTRPKAP